MGTLAWSQLRHRTSRCLALLAGMMLAATAFTVLSAASRTSPLRAIGVLTGHFQSAYQVLVRPRGKPDNRTVRVPAWHGIDPQ